MGCRLIFNSFKSKKLGIILSFLGGLISLQACFLPRKESLLKYHPCKEVRTSSKQKIFHTVKKGETLSEIARHYGVGIKSLVENNKLASPHHIKVGQKILIVKEKSIPSSKKFIWPLKGECIILNSEYQLQKGINIKPKDSLLVYASLDGVVKFARNLKGYGYTVILEHPDGYSTLYSNLYKCYVKEGEYIRKNSTIGEIGKNARYKDAFLHFEIKKGDKDLNPLFYLP